MTKELKSAASSALWSFLLLLGAFCFWHYLVGNPFDDLALIRRGHTVQGFIVDTWDEPQNGDEGGTQWLHGAIYKFRLPDGREFMQRTKDGSGRLKAEFRDLVEPVPIEVEYLPDNPDVSRIKGEGSSNLFDWLWRKVGLSSLLLALFLAPGFAMLRSAVREFMEFRQKGAKKS
jgi:uncharacterized protein DUF3592